jgi:hypothetical protein
MHGRTTIKTILLIFIDLMMGRKERACIWPLSLFAHGSYNWHNQLHIHIDRSLQLLWAAALF